MVYYGIYCGLLWFTVVYYSLLWFYWDDTGMILGSIWDINGIYRLEICYIGIEHGHLFMVSFPMNSMVMFHRLQRFAKGFHGFCTIHPAGDPPFLWNQG